MDPFRESRKMFFILMLATVAVAADKTTANYQKGTITQDPSVQHKAYELHGVAETDRIGGCGNFQNGQAVEYRVDGDTVHIRGADGKEFRCAVAVRTTAAPLATSLVYQKGTISGYLVRRERIASNGGSGNATGGTGATPLSLVFGGVHKAKVYELDGPDLTYQVDYCGAFQKGRFAPGQAVEYRVDGERLYIRHDNNQEYSCQIEGKRLAEKSVAAESAKPETPVAAKP